MVVTLVRSRGKEFDIPPKYAYEIEDGIFDNKDGQFGSVEQLAIFYGCMIDHDDTKYVDSN